MPAPSNHEHLGHLGAGLGCVAWAVISLVLLLAGGDLEGALLAALPCVLVSAGLWLLVTAALVLVQAVSGRGSRQFFAVLWGAIATAVAVLLLLAEHLVLPALQAHAGIARIMHATGSVMRVPWLLLLLPLVAGPALLLRPCLQLLRGTNAVPMSRSMSAGLLSWGLTSLLLATRHGGSAALVDAGLPALLLAMGLALLWSLVFAAAVRTQTAARRIGTGGALVVLAVTWCITDRLVLPCLRTGFDRPAAAVYLTVATLAQMVLLAIGWWALARPVFVAMRRPGITAGS